MLVAGNWLESIGAIFIGISASLCALTIGRDLGDALVNLFKLQENSLALSLPPGSDDNENQDTDSLCQGGRSWLKNVFMASVLAGVLIVMLAGTIVGAVLDIENAARRSFWASSMFAPLGATLRWVLSRMNPRHPRFPIGTFSANMAAVVLDVIVGVVLLTQPVSSDGVLFLSATITGLGGSLSTVSSWLAESVKLGRRHKYVYIIGSIACAQLLGVIIYGTAFWSSS